MKEMQYMGYTCSAREKNGGKSWVGYIEVHPAWKLRITGKTRGELEECFHDTVSRMVRGMQEIQWHFRTFPCH